MNSTIQKITAIAALTFAAGCSAENSLLPMTVSHDPILFVHGYARTSADWNTMIAQFKAAGWTDLEVYTINYGALQSNASIADDIKAKVDNILATRSTTKVDIVTHSMGSLSTRYYIRNLGGDGRVDAWVSLGGANHGTTTANDCGFPPCIELRPGSSFLASLNSGDETPGTVRYATWWSPADQAILPNNSVILSGATNTQTAPIPHQNLLTDPTVYNQVRAFIAP
ncbi:MAG: triacylglycerol lipase [Gemmatimonadaceae bacterium]|nr:triacylglycerol lipase [Gemmatimonadaceae bacterium]